MQMTEMQNNIKETIKNELRKLYSNIVVEYVENVDLRSDEIQSKYIYKMHSIGMENDSSGQFIPPHEGFPAYILIKQNTILHWDVMTAYHELRHATDYYYILSLIFNNDKDKMKNSEIYVATQVHSEFNAYLFGVFHYLLNVDLGYDSKKQKNSEVMKIFENVYDNDLYICKNNFEYLLCSICFFAKIQALELYDSETKIELNRYFNSFERFDELSQIFNMLLLAEFTIEWSNNFNIALRKFCQT